MKLNPGRLVYHPTSMAEYPPSGDLFRRLPNLPKSNENRRVLNKQPPNPILATRQNHALEHATIAILLQRSGVNTRIAGRASAGGFHLYGNLSTPVVEDAAKEALRRLKNGEAELALSPFCGTNIAVAGILAGVASILAMGSGNRFLNLPRVILATMVAVLAAQPLGKLVQKTPDHPHGPEQYGNHRRVQVGPGPLVFPQNRHRFYVRIGSGAEYRATRLSPSL